MGGSISVGRQSMAEPEGGTGDNKRLRWQWRTVAEAVVGPGGNDSGSGDNGKK